MAARLHGVLKAALLGSVAACLSAVLLVASLPPKGVWPLGFLCLVPTLVWARGRGVAWSFAGAMATVLAAAQISRMGLLYAPAILDGNPRWNYLGFVIFGLAVSATCVTVGVTSNRTAWYPLAAAALAVAFEAGLLPLLPAHLALTQSQVPWVVGMASFGGIWVCSYVVWLANLGVAHAIELRSARAFLPPFAVALLLVLVGLGVNLIVGEGVSRGEAMVGIVQTESNDLEQLTALNRKAGELGADLVIWPELSGLEIAAGDDTEALVALAKADSQPPFVTTFEDAHEPLPRNAAALFSASGESDRYYKRKPFAGERFRRLAGGVPVVVESPIGRIGLNVCFDSCFPRIMRETASLDPVLLALPTQDPRAPFGTVQGLHTAYNPFRAAELGLPLVSAECTAFSVFVDAYGRIEHLAGVGTEEVVVRKVDLRSRPTPYRVVGDWFLYLCALVSLGYVGGAIAARRRQS